MKIAVIHIIWTDLLKLEPRISTATSLVIKKNQNGKWTTQTLKLNNNQIEDITAIPALANEIFNDISSLTWLDVSCNKISSIPNTISNLRCLKIFYVHGNQIRSFQDVLKLKQLPLLSKLTLHGNPIEKEKGYFHVVLSILPRLVTLDFTGISRADQQTAALIRIPGQNKRQKEQ
ncbi:unnamed protein product [Heterobilharzia americana]|nr:unnamed protein product [Heterobilharzia americana]